MPIYEYRCNDCGRNFEVVQRMADDPVTVCEVCGGSVSRVLYAPAIHFKGSGFHNTDYGTKRRPAGGEGGGGDAGSGGGDKAASGNGGSASSSDSGSTASSGSSKSVGLDKV
ncbi:MAG: FmdB family zinc ribbon protein [Thermoleophilia bacterium]